MLVISVPLSETIVFGFPRPAMRLSNSRESRPPDRDVSAIRHRHSRVKSSTTARTRKRRPSVKASLTKSRLQRSLGRDGRTSGRLVPQSSLSTAALAHRQLLLTIETPELLQVHDDPLPIQHDVDAAIAETAALRRNLLHRLTNGRIVRPHAAISYA